MSLVRDLSTAKFKTNAFASSGSNRSTKVQVVVFIYKTQLGTGTRMERSLVVYVYMQVQEQGKDVKGCLKVVFIDILCLLQYMQLVSLAGLTMAKNPKKLSVLQNTTIFAYTCPLCPIFITTHSGYRTLITQRQRPNIIAAPFVQRYLIRGDFPYLRTTTARFPNISPSLRQTENKAIHQADNILDLVNPSQSPR